MNWEEEFVAICHVRKDGQLWPISSKILLLAPVASMKTILELGLVGLVGVWANKSRYNMAEKGFKQGP